MLLRVTALALLAGVSALSLTGTARSNGFQVRENSTAYHGTAFAGQASGDEDLSVLFANPATMTQFSGSQIEASGAVWVPQAVFTGSATTTGPGFAPVPVGGRGSDIDGGSRAFVPALYGVTSLTPDLKAGIAITAPFGLATDYEPDWVGRYNALRSELQTIDINPSLAWRALPWLSVGAGVSAQYERATLSRALNFGFLGAPDGNFRFDAKSWGFGANGGVLLQPLDGTRIGLAYRSQVHHRLEGDADFTVAAPVATLLGGAVADSEAAAELRSPATATASLTQRVTADLDVMLELQWIDWSVFDRLVVARSDMTPLTTQPENWHDTWFGALGAAWRANDALTLRGGVAYDQSPMDDEFRTARLPDQNRFWISVGLGYRFSDALAIDAGYSHAFIRADSRIDETTPDGTGAPDPTGARLVGSYDAAIDIVSIAARLRF